MLAAREVLYFLSDIGIFVCSNKRRKSKVSAAEAKDREAKLTTNSSDEHCDLQKHQMFSLRTAGIHERKDTGRTHPPQTGQSAMSHTRAVTLGVFPATRLFEDSTATRDVGRVHRSSAYTRSIGPCHLRLRHDCTFTREDNP